MMVAENAAFVSLNKSCKKTIPNTKAHSQSFTLTLAFALGPSLPILTANKATLRLKCGLGLDGDCECSLLTVHFPVLNFSSHLSSSLCSLCSATLLHCCIAALRCCSMLGCSKSISCISLSLHFLFLSSLSPFNLLLAFCLIFLIASFFLLLLPHSAHCYVEC